MNICYVGKNHRNSYSGQDFIDATDELGGVALTLENSVDRYIDSLGNYIVGDRSDRQLENNIERVVRSLEKVYDSLDRFDRIVGTDDLESRVELDGEKGRYFPEASLSEISGGAYTSIESFNDVIVFSNYIEHKDIRADERYLYSNDTSVGTWLMDERDRLTDIYGRLEESTDRIIFSEPLARRHTETEDNLELYSPEPPIFRILGHETHNERIRRLNERFRKKF